jgi:hypothetical protein
MPSNKNLKTEALLLGEDLRVVLDFDGLSNNQLVELVSDLKAKIKDRDTVTQADVKVDPPSPDVKVDPPAPTPTKPVLYKVAKGKSITCKKGILKEGVIIIKEYIGGDQVNFDRLIEKGCIIEM